MRVKNELQKRFIRFLVKDLFNAVSDEDILQIKGPNSWWMRGKRLDIQRIERLREQALYIKNSTLWKLMIQEIKYQSNLRMFERSNSPDDMLAGKTMLYNLQYVLFLNQQHSGVQYLYQVRFSIHQALLP